jgi:hypothetical protein
MDHDIFMLGELETLGVLALPATPADGVLYALAASPGQVPRLAAWSADARAWFSRSVWTGFVRRCRTDGRLYSWNGRDFVSLTPHDGRGPQADTQ